MEIVEIGDFSWQWQRFTSSLLQPITVLQIIFLQFQFQGHYQFLTELKQAEANHVQIVSVTDTFEWFQKENVK